MAVSEEKHQVGEEKTNSKLNLNQFSRLFENPEKSIEPYVKKCQVVADLGCNTGYYTFALAECVGPEGRVYAVDLEEENIKAWRKGRMNLVTATSNSTLHLPPT